MALERVAREIIEPTQEIVVEGFDPGGDLACVFEDDGVTGYLYATDFSQGGNPILDAVIVYQYTEGNPDKRQYVLEIVWRTDRNLCALLIDGHLYAAFDFDAQTGYNATGFPEPGEGWRREHPLDRIIPIIQGD